MIFGASDEPEGSAQHAFAWGSWLTQRIYLNEPQRLIL
jgi:hypothetical protein